MGVLAQNRQVLGFRAWTPNGVLALSSDGRGIGTDTASNPTLRGVLAGQLSSQIVQPRGPHDGYVTTLLHRHGPLLVVLAPVRLRPGGPVLAIAQVYLPYAPIAAAIRSDTHSMDGLLLAGLGVLYVTLFRLVAAASRRQRQQAECNRWLATHDALLLLDHNGFKGINDTLGHHHGDLLLKQLGPRLHRVLRDTDTLARLGGDEFVVLAADLATPEAASAITDKLHQALADPFLLDAEPVLVGASIGIAVAPNHGDRFEDLLKHADKAMYAAKGTNAPGHSPPSRAGARVSSHGLKAIEANAAH
jgi:diguanylate cyclase (GGDEF)-like protein